MLIVGCAFRHKKSKSIRHGSPWSKSRLPLKTIILLLYEFAKGNCNSSKKISEDFEISYKTIVEHRKIFRDILTQKNLRSEVDLGDKLVFDETKITGYKKKNTGRSHGDVTWTYLVANKEAKDRRLRVFNTQIRNSETLAPYFLDSIHATSDSVKGISYCLCSEARFIFHFVEI